jgi:hypothetical protein
MRRTKNQVHYQKPDLSISEDIVELARGVDVKIHYEPSTEKDTKTVATTATPSKNGYSVVRELVNFSVDVWLNQRYRSIIVYALDDEAVLLLNVTVSLSTLKVANITTLNANDLRLLLKNNLFDKLRFDGTVLYFREDSEDEKILDARALEELKQAEQEKNLKNAKIAATAKNRAFARNIKP